MPRVLVVVPTLGQRIPFLRQCLESIRDQGVASDVVIVRPANSEAVDRLAVELGCELMDDPGSLPGAINLGISTHGAGHDFVTWLGDDDLLASDSFRHVSGALDSRPEAVAAYGYCEYIDDGGQILWTSRAGPLATKILKWGPDLVPQPGILIRSHAWRLVGGLDDSYRFAFDLDLLLKLQKIGKIASVQKVVSSFRWHSGSLTVSDRRTNLFESEQAKRTHLRPILRPIAPLWEAPVRVATRVAANRVNQRVGR